MVSSNFQFSVSASTEGLGSRSMSGASVISVKSSTSSTKN
jgi:hypothetical protein